MHKLQYQVAIFPKDFFRDDVSIIFEELKKIKCFSGGENSLFPIPSSAPREIPRMTFISPDGNLTLRLSFKKLDFFWDSPESIKEKDIIEVVRDVVTAIKTTDFTRIGLIGIFHIDYQEGFYSKLFKTSFNNSVSGFSAKINYDRNVGNFSCNKLISIDSASFYPNIESNPKRIIKFCSDLNTKEVKNFSINESEIIKFINGAFPINTAETLEEDLGIKNIDG